MASNLQIITSALRLIGVLSEGETASAEQGVDGLEAMNDLFAQWDGNNIDIGHFPQAEVTATSPIFADAMQAAKYNLALVLCVEYGREPPAAVVAVAMDGYKRLERDSVVAQLEPVDMSHLPGTWDVFDIENG
jgi:hypothetical protein